MKILQRFLLAKVRLRETGLRIQHFKERETPLAVTFRNRVRGSAGLGYREVAQDRQFAQRLGHMERLFGETEWLAAGRFTVADLLMADVLRVPAVRKFGERPATEAYVSRITSRAAFRKAHADQIAHFAAADQKKRG